MGPSVATLMHACNCVWTPMCEAAPARAKRVTQQSRPQQVRELPCKSGMSPVVHTKIPYPRVYCRVYCRSSQGTHGQPDFPGHAMLPWKDSQTECGMGTVDHPHTLSLCWPLVATRQSMIHRAVTQHSRVQPHTLQFRVDAWPWPGPDASPNDLHNYGT